MSNPLLGASYLFRGIGLIMKPGVKRHVLIPLIVNIAVFAVLIVAGVGGFSELVNWLLPTLPDWLAWLDFILWFLFAVAAVIVIFFTFTFVANLISAPFNPFLSAAVERQLTGKQPESMKGIAAETKDAIIGELKKWAYFIMWAVPLLILTFIPVVNVLAPVAWFIFGAWMLSIEYLDYPMGNYGLTFPDIRKQVGKKRLLSLGFGATATLATMIPVVNFFVMPVAVAAATALRVEQYPLK